MDADRKNPAPSHAHSQGSEDKKSRRLSTSVHHGKTYYKEKFENQEKITAELSGDIKHKILEILELRKQVQQLTEQNNQLRLQLGTPLNPTASKPEPVVMTTASEAPVKPTPVLSSSYKDKLSSAMNSAYGYVPSFAALKNKLPNIPSIPRLFDPVPNHHETTSTPAPKI
jgi:hypothetical protein